jgi:hypothetical protein
MSLVVSISMVVRPFGAPASLSRAAALLPGHV